MLQSFITIMLVVLLTKHVDKISFANRSKVIVVVEPIFLAQVMQRYSNHSLSNDTLDLSLIPSTIWCSHFIYLF